MSPLYMLETKYGADRVFVNEDAMLCHLRYQKHIMKLTESFDIKFNEISRYSVLHIYSHASWLKTGMSLILSESNWAVS
jgi:hypothetical protein